MKYIDSISKYRVGPFMREVFDADGKLVNAEAFGKAFAYYYTSCYEQETENPDQFAKIASDFINKSALIQVTEIEPIADAWSYALGWDEGKKVDALALADYYAAERKKSCIEKNSDGKKVYHWEMFPEVLSAVMGNESTIVAEAKANAGAKAAAEAEKKNKAMIAEFKKDLSPEQRKEYNKIVKDVEKSEEFNNLDNDAKIAKLDEMVAEVAAAKAAKDAEKAARAAARANKPSRKAKESVEALEEDIPLAEGEEVIVESSEEDDDTLAKFGI